MNRIKRWLKEKAPDEKNDTVIIGNILMGVSLGTKNVIIIPSFRRVAIVSDSYLAYSKHKAKTGTSTMESIKLTQA
jgi:hypothetical protein